MATKSAILEQAEALGPELIRLRRAIHRRPELGFEEFHTAALVADTLEEIGGFTVRTGVGRTGVVAEIGSDDGAVIAIRGDMDALPIAEQNDVPYRSEVEGVMHACGHDAHTAILLGTAHLLRQSLSAGSQWRGKVRLLFQPSEERFGKDLISGATAMIDDGALDGVTAVYALHVSSVAKAGVCEFQDGYTHAAVDAFDAWIFGEGGHGAYPHSGTDPLFMLGPILNALYAIPSRRINPLRPVVVSLGKICGGATTNVIPAEVHLQGTIRSYEPDVREQLWQEVERAFAISETLGGHYRLEIQKGYPAMRNNPDVNDWLRQTATDLLGPERVADAEFGMGAEDFAYMTQKAPGAMFNLGAARGDRRRPHHTPHFDIDESVLPMGAAILAETALRFLTGRYSLPGENA